VRVVVGPALGARNSDRLKELHHPGACLPLGDVAVELDRLDELAPDRVHGIQRRHRVLEDHRDVVAADVSELARAHRDQVVALEHGLAARDRVAAVVQPHHRQAGDALAAAGFADDPERLPLLDGEADTVDGLHDSVVGPEVGLQVVDLEKGH
jgi:hypothetical protein